MSKYKKYAQKYGSSYFRKYTYTQDHLKQFGLAVASKLGVRIKYDNDYFGKTLGDTVVIPPITSPLSDDEFTGVCGVICHESAHIYYGSKNPAYSVPLDVLGILCRDAVFDIADDERLAREYESTARLVHFKDSQYIRYVGSGHQRNKKAPMAETLMHAVAMCKIGRDDTLGDKYSRSDLAASAKSVNKFASERLVDKSIDILDTIKETRTGDRSAAEWAALGEVVRKLYELLNRYQDPNSQPPPPALGCLGWDCENGYGALPQEMTRTGRFDESTYRRSKSVICDAIARMAEVKDAEGAMDGFRSGPVLSRRQERVAIDGRCFAKKIAEGEKLYGAILLDVSGSMEEHIDEVSAIAQSFSDAVDLVADKSIKVTFSDVAREVSTFRSAQASGDTYTKEAVDIAYSFFENKGGRRVCVIITDGFPNLGYYPDKVIRSMLKQGTRVIGIGYGGMNKANLQASMPGADIVMASGVRELGNRLMEIAKRIAVSDE